MAGLYLHIPFCKQACHYCDFHFSTNLSGRAEIINAMVQEIKMQKDYLTNDDAIRTIYFGGGTPSLLSPGEVGDLLGAIYSVFRVADDAEITFEANPDDLSLETLSYLKSAGVNRLSIGIQSFDDGVLKFLNRAHDSTGAIRSVHDAQQKGFTNISIDLIYAIPDQQNDAWVKNIRQAIYLNPQHISSYSLTIEEKTVFGRWSVQGKLKNVDDEIAAEQLEILMEKMEAAGYDQYEISNFGKPGFYSNHNSSYWKREKYLGIGPSAHSYNGISRQFNVSSNHAYLKAIKNNKIPFELETLTREHMINEYLLTTLRTQWGCNLKILEKEYDHNVAEKHTPYLSTLEREGLISINNSIITLTNTGKLLADKIASDLFC